LQLIRLKKQLKIIRIRNIECTVVDSIMTGSHEMFIGKIEYVHADADLVKEDGSIAWDKIELL